MFLPPLIFYVFYFADDGAMGAINVRDFDRTEKDIIHSTLILLHTVHTIPFYE